MSFMFGLHTLSSLLEHYPKICKLEAKIHSFLLVLGNHYVLLCLEQVFFTLDLISPQHGTFVVVVQLNMMKGSLSSRLWQPKKSEELHLQIAKNKNYSCDGKNLSIPNQS